jgi:SAM-dependent methyltransferase
MTSRNLKDKFPIYHTNWLNRRKIIDVIQWAADKYAKGILLDLGCGAKQYKQLFDGKVDEYFGLDLRLRGSHPGETEPDILASALQPPLPSNAFDTVVSFQVLEHVPEPKAMFKEISRVLKPNGYLILMAPQMWHLHEVPHDYFRYTRYGLTHLAEQSGLNVITIQPISGFWIRAGLVTSYRLDKILLGQRIRNLKAAQIGIQAMIVISNLFFWSLDKIWSRPNDPINNLLVAKKCSSQAHTNPK